MKKPLFGIGQRVYFVVNDNVISARIKRIFLAVDRSRVYLYHTDFYHSNFPDLLIPESLLHNTKKSADAVNEASMIINKINNERLTR